MQNPDYIIVGAGSAGAGLAYQLAKDGRSKVLLLEAGPSHRHPFVSMPKGIGKILGSERRTWQYEIDNEASGTPEHWVRGRLLGGSSAVNGMMYFRGQKADYDDWAEAGATGWDGDEMMRVFREMEDHASGGADGRGVDGPLKISIPESGDPLIEGFIEAGTQMGVPRVHDPWRRSLQFRPCLSRPTQEVQQPADCNRIRGRSRFIRWPAGVRRCGCP